MPDDAAPAIEDTALVAQCQAVLARGSVSFSRAARLLEPATREGCCLLYAWGRHCDDVIDGQTLGLEQRAVDPTTLSASLTRLRTETEAALTGQAADLPFRALALLVHRHAIPPELPRALLDGMAMDAAGRRYRTLNELIEYCHCVAGVVAIMAGRVMGLDDPAVLHRLGSVGEAVQLTNIARDIIDDAKAGRVYLPLEWLHAGGVPPEEITAPGHRAALARVTNRLLDEADRRYAEAEPVIAQLPIRSAAAVAVGRALYSAIGTEIRRRGPRAWDRRARISRLRRIILTITCLVSMLAKRISRAR